MLHRERVELALARKQADRPPKGEILIDTDYIELVEPGYTDEFSALKHVLDAYDLDLVCKDLWRPAPEQIGTNDHGLPIYRDCWGVTYAYSPDGLLYSDFLIHKPAAADAYTFPDAGIYKADFLGRWKNESDRFVGGIVGGTFDNLIPLIGFDAIMFWTVEAPEALSTAAWKAARFNADLGEIIAAAGADFVLVADDMAYNSGTFVDPETMRSVFFPPMKWLVGEIHRRTSLPVFLHCDGNINAILDDIVECGFDGLQSLQPSAGMDIRRIKKDYGQKLCLMGNIDLNELLPYGTPEQITAHVKALAKDLAPGGGWILSTCNTLSRAVPPANAAAMYAAIDVQ